MDRNTFCRLPSDLYAVVPRKGDVDRNYTANGWTQGRGKSSPARGTWIEISASPHFCQQRRVVPRKGDVDRNITSLPGQAVAWVVPRKGDVDRNVSVSSLTVQLSPSSPARGTWIEIIDSSSHATKRVMSSPARGTWIEMLICRRQTSTRASSPARGTWIEIRKPLPARLRESVVPRKGDVDRNKQHIRFDAHDFGSSPARGTWIEIPLPTGRPHHRAVVPRKGDVDRNKSVAMVLTQTAGVVPRKGDVDRNISRGIVVGGLVVVVPRKGDVDRNGAV